MNKRQYLSQKYCYMRDRVSDKSRSAGGRNYFRQPLCDREAFLEFGLTDDNFNRLFKNYKRSQGKRSKAPSVDRIKSNKGYQLDNIQFLSLSENSSKVKQEKWVVLQDSKTKRMHRFASAGEAGRFLRHKWHVHVSRKTFTHMKTGRVYLNRTNLKNKPV